MRGPLSFCPPQQEGQQLPRPARWSGLYFWAYPKPWSKNAPISCKPTDTSPRRGFSFESRRRVSQSCGLGGADAGEAEHFLDALNTTLQAFEDRRAILSRLAAPSGRLLPALPCL